MSLPHNPNTDNVQEKKPLVWIVILHWQAAHFTRACLTSLGNLEYSNYRVLLVDNGSDDHSGSTIAKLFPNVQLLSLSENLGFSGGCNVGIKYCLDAGAEWIWLLNNDTKVFAESLDRLMQAAIDCPKVGALGGLVLTPSGQEYATSGVGEIDFLRAKTFLRKLSSQASAAISCEWLSGSNLLLRKEALNQAGLFDDKYFLYFEDTELCYRLRQFGWSCLLVPEARIEHVGGGSTVGKLSHWRSYYYTRNRLLFFSASLPGMRCLPAMFFIAGHLLRHAVVLPFRGTAGRRQLKAEFLGLRDYWTKNFGKATCLDWCEKG